MSEADLLVRILAQQGQWIKVLNAVNEALGLTPFLEPPPGFLYTVPWR